MSFFDRLKILESSANYDREYKRIITSLTPLNVPWDIETELNVEEREKYK